jgi:hypothetical protein
MYFDIIFALNRTYRLIVCVEDHSELQGEGLSVIIIVIKSGRIQPFLFKNPLIKSGRLRRDL